MPDSYDSKFLDEPEFQSLLVACLESLQRGEHIDREAIARDFPKYASEVGRFLETRQLLQQMASEFPHARPFRAAASSIENTSAPDSGHDDFAIGESIRYIGEYEILEEIARGGMGIVFKARQQKLNRIVALKMILAGRLADAAEVERFQREACTAGRLNHPHIVSIHEIGEHEGRHYFTMDFVKGRSLAEAIGEGALAPRLAAQLVCTTAEAVQYAHEQGTIHRDLKPANVLLDEKGQPHITDFGLAKLLESMDEDSRAGLTASGQILGTPSYMSPEQAMAKHQLVGVTSDVYALGAILYACVSGRAPFVAWDTTGERLAASWDWPARMIRIYDEEGRVTSLPQTKTELRSIAWDSQGNEIVSVGNDQGIYFWNVESKSLMRETHLHSSALISVDWNSSQNLGVSVESTGIAKVWGSDEVPSTSGQIRVDATGLRVHWSAQSHLVACGGTKSIFVCDADQCSVEYKFKALGGREFGNLDWHPALPLLAIQDRSGRVVVRNVTTGKNVFDQLGSSWDFNRSIAWSPNGRYVASGSGQKWYANADGCVDVWDFNSGEKVCSLGSKGRSRTCVAWSGDSRLLAVGGSWGDRRLEVWDLASQSMISTTDEILRFLQVAWSPDSRLVAAAAIEGPVVLIEAASGKRVGELASHNQVVTRVQWSPDGHRILTSSDDGTLRIWDAATAEELLVIGPEPPVGYSACWSPDGRRIATFSDESILRIWGSPQLELNHDPEVVPDARFATVAAPSHEHSP